MKQILLILITALTCLLGCQSIHEPLPPGVAPRPTLVDLSRGWQTHEYKLKELERRVKLLEEQRKGNPTK
jgi:hypothetical protein